MMPAVTTGTLTGLGIDMSHGMGTSRATAQRDRLRGRRTTDRRGAVSGVA
jgi:hypothetical protein